MSNVAIHPYDNHSRAYNFFFHPLHFKEKWKTVLAIITNIGLSILTFGLYQIPFWIVNRLDNRKLEMWKKEQAEKVEEVAVEALPTTEPSKEPKAPPEPEQPKEKGPKIRAREVVPILVQLAEVKIPAPVQNSLDAVFGCKDFFNKVPLSTKHSIDCFSPEEFDEPVMAFNNRQGNPIIVIKVVAADPENYYEKRVKRNVERLMHEDQWEETKNLELDEIKTRQHLIVLTQKFQTGSKLQWEQEDNLDNSNPRFFAGDLTHPETGTLQESTKKQLPAFQTLFTTGEAADLFNMKWKIVDFEKVRARFFAPPS